MELLHNKAINQQTRKALFITMGLIAVGGIAIYYSQKHQRTKYRVLNREHMNYVNFAHAKINDLSQIVTEKDNKIMEQENIIRHLQDEYIILKNNKIAQRKKENNEANPL